MARRKQTAISASVQPTVHDTSSQTRSRQFCGSLARPARRVSQPPARSGRYGARTGSPSRRDAAARWRLAIQRVAGTDRASMPRPTVIGISPSPTTLTMNNAIVMAPDTRYGKPTSRPNQAEVRGLVTPSMLARPGGPVGGANGGGVWGGCHGSTMRTATAGGHGPPPVSGGGGNSTANGARAYGRDDGSPGEDSRRRSRQRRRGGRLRQHDRPPRRRDRPVRHQRRPGRGRGARPAPRPAVRRRRPRASAAPTSRCAPAPTSSS